MGILELILVAAIVAQVLFTVQVVCNSHYAKQKSGRDRTVFRPRCVLMVPCKGLDDEFDKNIRS